MPPHHVRRAFDGSRRAERGQSMVEFALVALPLFTLILGVVQFGFIFNTYVTIANGVREAAREGTIYQSGTACTQAQNDAGRNEAIRTTLLNSLNLLSRTSPQLTTTAAGGSGCSVSGGWSSPITSGTKTTYTNGDVTVIYELPDGVTDSFARAGQRVTVRANYHQDLVVPLISLFLPKDSGGRLVLSGEVTMVIN